MLATAGEHSGVVKLWSASSGEPLASLEGHTGAVTSLSVGEAIGGGGGGGAAETGVVLLSTGADCTARLWGPLGGAAPPACLAVLEPAEGHVGAATCGALATGSTGTRSQRLLAAGFVSSNRSFRSELTTMIHVKVQDALAQAARWPRTG